MNSKRPRPAESAAGEVAAVPLKPKHQLRARNCNSSSHNAAAGHVRGAGTSGAKARDAPLLSHIATIAAPETGEELASHHRELVSTGGHIGVWSTDSAQMETAPIDHATKAHDAAEVSMLSLTHPLAAASLLLALATSYTSYDTPYLFLRSRFRAASPCLLLTYAHSPAGRVSRIVPRVPQRRGGRDQDGKQRRALGGEKRPPARCSRCKRGGDGRRHRRRCRNGCRARAANGAATVGPARWSAGGAEL